MTFLKLLAVFSFLYFQNAQAFEFSITDTEHQSIALIASALNLFSNPSNRPPNATTHIYASGAHKKPIIGVAQNDKGLTPTIHLSVKNANLSNPNIHTT